MPPTPPVSVVVPCHAARDAVPALLDGLEAQTLDPGEFEVLLVDPGLDDTAAVVAERLRGWSGAEVSVVPGPREGGPATKRNAGAARAAGGLLAFTDSDCVPRPGWLEAGLRVHRDGADVVQGAVRLPEGQRAGRLAHAITVDEDHGLFESSNIFYARELFDRLGGFSRHYFDRYGAPFGEDAELGWRARRAGAVYSFEPEAQVEHPVGAPSWTRHLREQWLARGFPELARDIPELRESLFWRRWFLSRESARTAAAVAALALARPTRGASLMAALPYARSLRAAAATGGPADAAAKLASDATLTTALAWGSLRSRSLVL